MPLPRPRPDPAPLADPALRSALVAMVRRRVPAHEVDEIVQATLADALASSTRPADPEALRRWVHGIARHKVVDFHRARGRETSVEDPDELDAQRVGSAPTDPDTAADLLRWAEREIPTPNQARTLGWMLRESDGEKLESIAREESLPAPQVRQRVARLRRHYRLRWAAQLAAAAAIAAVVGALVVYFAIGRASPRLHDDRPLPLPGGAPTVAPPLAPPPSPAIDPAVLGRALRGAALERCQRHEWYPCLRGLDDAAMLDPAGDRDDAVSAARQAASGAIAPPPSKSAAPAAPSPAPKGLFAPPTGAAGPPKKTKLDPFDVF